MPAPSPAARAAVRRDIEPRIAAVRRFSRFYTRRLGLLHDGFLDSPFSLAEARVLYELSRREATTASAVAAELDLDPGYLSRILRSFAECGLVSRTRSSEDRRQSRLALTAKGRKAFAPLERRSHDDAAAMLAPLPDTDQERVVAAMGAIERLIGAPRRAPGDAQQAYTLRSPRAGELGWAVQRHGELYAREYGWGAPFEGLCAEIVAHYVKHHDPARERCWIADLEGEPVGCVFLEQGSAEIAKLRLLLVD